MTKLLSLALAVVAGCGQVRALSVDAASSSDDASRDGASPNVTVTVVERKGTRTVEGASVVFLDRDGTLVAHVVTDAHGKARANIPAGASVTSVSMAEHASQTVFGIQPGDDLTLGQTTIDTTPVGTFRVSFTPAGATDYAVLGPCGAASAMGTTATLTILQYCQQPTMELVVVAGATGSTAIDKVGVPYTNGGSVDLGSSYTPSVAVEEDYTNIPPSVSQIGILRSAVGFVTAGVKVAPSATTLALSIRGIQTAIALVQSQLFHANGAQQLVQRAVLGTATSDTFDVGATMLAWIGRPTFDATTQGISVPIEPSGGANPAPDVFVTHLQYTRVVNGAPVSFEWRTFSATPGDITLPTLPIEAGDVNPKTTDAVTSLTAEAFDFDGFANYASVRQRASGLVVIQPYNQNLSYRRSQSP